MHEDLYWSICVVIEYVALTEVKYYMEQQFLYVKAYSTDIKEDSHATRGFNNISIN